MATSSYQVIVIPADINTPVYLQTITRNSCLGENNQLRSIVGGWLELCFFIDKSATMYCNEDGIELNLPENQHLLTNFGIHILGNCFISRVDDEGNEIGITEDESKNVQTAWLDIYRKILDSS